MNQNNSELMNDTTKIYFVCNFLGFFMLLFVLYMVLNMQRKIIVHDQEINALKLQISASESVANV